MALPVGAGLWVAGRGHVQPQPPGPPRCPRPRKACLVLPAETHPRPPKPDPVKSVSGVLSGLTPARSAPVINNGSPTILGKRSYEQHNGVDGESGGGPWGREAGGVACGPGRLAPGPPPGAR